MPGGLFAKIIARFRCQYFNNEGGVDSEVGVGMTPPPPVTLGTIAPLNLIVPGTGCWVEWGGLMAEAACDENSNEAKCNGDTEGKLAFA